MAFFYLMDSIIPVLGVIHDVLYSFGYLTAEEIDVVASYFIKSLLGNYTARYGTRRL